MGGMQAEEMTGQKKPDYDAGNNSKAAGAPMDDLTAFVPNLARYEAFMDERIFRS